MRCASAPLFIILSSLLAIQADAAQPTSAEPAAAIEQLRIGLANHYKVGFWTPVEVTVAGGSQMLEVELQIVVPDGDGTPTVVTQNGVRLQPGQKTRVRTYVKFGAPHAPVAVSLRTSPDAPPFAERTFAGDEVPVALPATDRLILEIGSPLDLGSLARFNDEGEPDPATIAFVDRPEELPDRWFGYDGVDLMILTTCRSAIYRRMPAETVAAIHRWNQLEGRLVLSVGAHGDEILGDGPLASLAPGRFARTIVLKRLAAIESFAGATDRIGRGEAGEPAVIQAAQLTDVRGRIEAYEGTRPEELPLVVRRAEGFGELIFTAVDLDEAPLKQWVARPQFLAALLNRNSAGAGAQASESQALGSRLGYDDLSGQLRLALDQFPDVRPTPFGIVALLAIGYILLLFPLDYLVARKLPRAGRHGLGFDLAC